jgi:hypothetical protein
MVAVLRVNAHAMLVLKALTVPFTTAMAKVS